MVEFLINKGINLQIRDKKNQTLIQEATKRKRPQMIELLVKQAGQAKTQSLRNPEGEQKRT